MLSLIMQYSISLLAVGLHALFVSIHFMRQRKLQNHPSAENDSLISKPLKADRKNLNRHLGALTSALIEFQKAQCFFSATLQVAAIIVLGDILYKAEDKNNLLLRLASANAFSPILLTLVHINLLGGRRSWYILSLSTITYLLGTMTFQLATNMQRGNYNYFSNIEIDVLSCGGYSPIAPCFRNNDNYATGKWGTYGDPLPLYYPALWVWILSSLIWMIQIMEKICGTKRVKDFMKSNRGVLVTRQAFRTHFKAFASQPSTKVKLTSGKLFLPTLPRKRFHGAMLRQLRKGRFWLLVQLLIGMGGLIAQLAFIINSMLNSYKLIPKRMTFGQIVAMGIWIPVLLEYVYLEYSKSAALEGLVGALPN